MEGMKVKDMVNILSYGQLVKLLKDLSSGGHHVRNIVEHRIQELEVEDRKVCAFCGSPVSSNDSPYTLLFGSKDFRKKASFCGLDCMDSFNKNLRLFSQRKLEK